MALRVQPDANDCLTRAIVDPYVNAIHVSLLREKKLNPIYAQELAEVGEGSAEMQVIRDRLLRDGPAALAPAEKLRLMSDSETMAWLHSRVWTLPGEDLNRFMAPRPARRLRLSQ